MCDSGLFFNFFRLIRQNMGESGCSGEVCALSREGRSHFCSPAPRSQGDSTSIASPSCLPAQIFCSRARSPSRRARLGQRRGVLEERQNLSAHGWTHFSFLGGLEEPSPSVEVAGILVIATQAPQHGGRKRPCGRVGWVCWGAGVHGLFMRYAERSPRAFRHAVGPCALKIGLGSPHAG